MKTNSQQNNAEEQGYTSPLPPLCKKDKSFEDGYNDGSLTTADTNYKIKGIER